MQDGLRLFLNGNIHFPIPDVPPGAGEDELDHEDQGQKGFNYRTEPVGPNTNGEGLPAPGDWLANPDPATPVWYVPVNRPVHFHLVGACDKPRNHSFTIHGVTWPEWRFLSPRNSRGSPPRGPSPAARPAPSSSPPSTRGDHAYRSGVLKWDVSQGLWGILRVVRDAPGREGPA
jgi:hypothetical protein